MKLRKIRNNIVFNNECLTNIFITSNIAKSQYLHEMYGYYSSNFFLI
jgi:hypothetical protein